MKKGVRLEAVSSCMFAIGLLLVGLMSILHLWWPYFAGWGISCGGFLLVISYFCKKRRQEDTKDIVRLRRLDRMGFLGGLCYLVSGQFALRELPLWIMLFVVGTIFMVYSIFVTDKIVR